MVKKAEYAKNVAALLHSDFIEPICVFNVFQIIFRHSWQFFYSDKSADDFIVHILVPEYKEKVKVVAVKYHEHIARYFVVCGKLGKADLRRNNC